MTASSAPERVRVSFILIPGFALTSFSLAIEALSVANLLSDSGRYDYGLYSGDPDPTVISVHSSNGVPVQTRGHVSQCPDCDILFVCAYQQAARRQNPAVIATLRRLSRGGCRFASLSCGSFLLAGAGILENQRCTLVHEQISTFRELYPDVPVLENLYTISGRVLSCAGGMSALDMLLYIIGQDYGADFATEVCHQFLQERIRSDKEALNASRYLKLRMKSASLGAAIELMEASIETPLSVEEIASRIGTSLRTLEQVFRRHEASTPGQYYLRLRLDRARQLVEDTNMNIATIAQATGFTSQSYFTRRFREQFGIPPGQLRQQLRV